MDVDEFLDRELADMGLSEKHEINSQGNSVASGIFEGISSNVERESLTDTEQDYIKLWNVLSGQKLKWNKELYEQLNSLARKLSLLLQKAYDETKKKSDHVNALISRAQSALKEGKKDMPMKCYAEMEQTVNSIPNVFFEEKKTIQEQVILFYRELVNITDSELSKRIAGLVGQITRMINEEDGLIRAGRYDDANTGYIRLIELFNQIPEGFLKVKNSLGLRILDIYKTISIYSEISELQKQIGTVTQPRPQTAIARPFESHFNPVQQRKLSAVRYQKIRPNSNYAARRAQKKAEKKQTEAEKKAIPAEAQEISSNETIMDRKREHAKKNIKKGFLNEAWNDLDEVLKVDPNDVEAKALRAKIKTLQ